MKIYSLMYNFIVSWPANWQLVKNRYFEEQLIDCSCINLQSFMFILQNTQYIHIWSSLFGLKVNVIYYSLHDIGRISSENTLDNIADESKYNPDNLRLMNLPPNYYKIGKRFNNDTESNLNGKNTWLTCVFIIRCIYLMVEL